MEKAAPGIERKSAEDISRLLNLRLPVIVKLADKKMTFEAISAMLVGTIIEFDKQATEQLELMIRNKAIGQGKVVRSGDYYGLRITSISDVLDTISAMADGQ